MTPPAASGRTDVRRRRQSQQACREAARPLSAAWKVSESRVCRPSCQDAHSRDPGSRWTTVHCGGAISRYPRLPLGVIHAVRGAKHHAARRRVCEWRTRAGVVVVVDIFQHPSVAAPATSAARAINSARQSAPQLTAVLCRRRYGCPCHTRYTRRACTRCRFFHLDLISTVNSN